MKWAYDEYEDLKWNIFDLLIENFSEEDASNTTIDIACDAIDELIEKCKKAKGKL